MALRKIIHTDRQQSIFSVTHSDDETDPIFTCETKDGNAVSVYIPRELFVQFEKIGDAWTLKNARNL